MLPILLILPPGTHKERVKSRGSRLLSNTREIKICQRCFLCHSITLCKTCNKYPKCCHKSACRGQTSKLLENLAGSGGRSESSSNPERGLYPPLSDPAKTHKISYRHKLLCQSPQEQLPVGGITSAYRQECNRTIVRNKTSLSFFNRLFLVPKPNQKWRPILDLSNLNFFLKAEKFKMDSGGTIRRELDFQTRVHILASTLIPIGNVGDEKKTKPRKTF